MEREQQRSRATGMQREADARAVALWREDVTGEDADGVDFIGLLIGEEVAGNHLTPVAPLEDAVLHAGE